MRSFAALIVLLSLGLAPLQGQADAKTDQRLTDARQVFETFVDIREQVIPTWLMERAYGIVVVPRVIKGALIIGGRGGKGVLAVRNPDGSWSDPVFITLAGVNVGFQWGVQSTDVVLVLMSRRSVEGIAGGKVTLGADAAVAAGPVGRQAAATTDATLKAQVLSYSRSEGIFAGVALDGSVLSIDDKANASAYGTVDIRPSQILEGGVATAPEGARQFTAALERATQTATGAAAAGSAAPSPGVPAPDSTPQPAPTAPEGAETFPMEDPAPGAPPPE
jgi:lipid-binding SYLF domain-containing protein